MKDINGMSETGSGTPYEYAVPNPQPAEVSAMRPVNEETPKSSIQLMVEAANQYTEARDTYHFGTHKGEARSFKLNDDGRKQVASVSEALKTAEVNDIRQMQAQLNEYKENDVPLSLQQRAVVNSLQGVVNTRLRFQEHSNDVQETARIPRTETPIQIIEPQELEGAVTAMVAEAAHYAKAQDRYHYGKRKGEVRAYTLSENGKHQIDRVSESLRTAGIDQMIEIYDQLMLYKENGVPLSLQQKAMVNSLLGVVKTRLRFRVHDIFEGGSITANSDSSPNPSSYKKAEPHMYQVFMQDLKNPPMAQDDTGKTVQMTRDDVYYNTAVILRESKVDFKNGQLMNTETNKPIIYRTAAERIYDVGGRRWALAGIGATVATAAVTSGKAMYELGKEIFTPHVAVAAEAKPTESSALEAAIAAATAAAKTEPTAAPATTPTPDNGDDDKKAAGAFDEDEIRQMKHDMAQQARKDRAPKKYGSETVEFGGMQFTQSEGKVTAPDIYIGAENVRIGNKDAVSQRGDKGFIAVIQPHKYEGDDAEAESPQSDGEKRFWRTDTQNNKKEVRIPNAYETSDHTGFDYVKVETTVDGKITFVDPIIEMHSRNVKRNNKLIPHPGETIRYMIDRTAGKVSEFPALDLNLACDQMSGTIVRMSQVGDDGVKREYYAMMMVDRLPPDITTEYYKEKAAKVRQMVNKARARRRATEGIQIPDVAKPNPQGEVWARICGNRAKDEKKETTNRGTNADVVDWEQAIIVAQFIRLTTEQATILAKAQRDAQAKGEYISRVQLEELRAAWAK